MRGRTSRPVRQPPLGPGTLGGPSPVRPRPRGRRSRRPVLASGSRRDERDGAHERSEATDADVIIAAPDPRGAMRDREADRRPCRAGMRATRPALDRVAQPRASRCDTRPAPRPPCRELGARTQPHSSPTSVCAIGRDAGARGPCASDPDAASRTPAPALQPAGRPRRLFASPRRPSAGAQQPALRGARHDHAHAVEPARRS